MNEIRFLRLLKYNRKKVVPHTMHNTTFWKIIVFIDRKLPIYAILLLLDFVNISIDYSYGCDVHNVLDAAL